MFLFGLVDKFVELIQFVFILKIKSDSQRGIYFITFAFTERTTKISWLFFILFLFWVLHKVWIQINEVILFFSDKIERSSRLATKYPFKIHTFHEWLEDSQIIGLTFIKTDSTKQNNGHSLSIFITVCANQILFFMWLITALRWFFKHFINDLIIK